MAVDAKGHKARGAGLYRGRSPEPQKASVLHPYLESLRGDLEKSLEGSRLDGWVDSGSGPEKRILTPQEAADQALRTIERNVSAAHLDLLRSEGVQILAKHNSNKSALKDLSAGHWSPRTKEIILRPEYILKHPSVLRHEVGHAISENIRARVMHFRSADRGFLLDQDRNFQKAIQSDLARIRKSSDAALKKYALKDMEYFSSSSPVVSGLNRQQNKEMFAETFAHVTSPVGIGSARWRQAFPDTYRAVASIVSTISHPLKNNQAARFGSASAK